MPERLVVDVPEEQLADLRSRLRATRWPDALPGSGWDYGTDLAYLQDLCRSWAESFDWRAAEARLNSWEHFRTVVDGEQLHYVHAPSPHPGALPLLLTHGWPGSVVEFLGVLGPLTDPPAYGGDAADAFSVVAPSIPGYGWSGPTRQRGWNIRRVARALATLMAELGYARYGAQGGDWGGIAKFRRRETGYQAIQGTKPQTLAYALNDSPAGLPGGSSRSSARGATAAATSSRPSRARTC